MEHSEQLLKALVEPGVKVGFWEIRAAMKAE